MLIEEKLPYKEQKMREEQAQKDRLEQKQDI